MPNAVFFKDGIALHATSSDQYHKLGTRASGGCIRLTLKDSQFISEKIMETGKGDRPDQFQLIRVEKGRKKIVNNTVKVKQISRPDGQLTNKHIDSWDTVIVVYEE